MELLTIGITAAVLVILLAVRKSFKKDKKREVSAGVKEPTVSTPPIPDDEYETPPESNPPHPVEDEVIPDDFRPPETPETPTPKKGEVFEYKVPEEGHLANFDTAAKTKAISLVGIKPINKVIDGQVKMLKGNRLYKFNDVGFKAYIAKTSTFSYGVLYLCDKEGNVYDYSISAPGGKRNLKYTKAMFKGNPYIFVASNTNSMNAIVRKLR